MSQDVFNARGNMLRNQPLIAFVATARPGESLTFYRDILGMELVEDSPFALVFKTPRNMLRIQKVQQLAPAAHTILGWEVTDIRTYIAELTALGATFTRYPGMPQDEHGVWSSPSGAQIAWFRDPDGNVLSLTQSGS